MIVHYLKIAWRNLLRYKTQSVISILGLAIGFTAFSFTLSWIRYERGYDKHNPDADRIYCITGKEGVTALPPYGLTDYVRKNFPEVEAACNAISGQFSFPGEHEQNERERFEKEARFSVFADTAFFSVFYPETKISYPSPLPIGAAVFTRSIAEKWDITPEKIGQKIDSLDLIPIAIVDDKPLSSNVAFRYLYLSNTYERDVQNLWNNYSGLTYIRLHKGASIERIERELDSLEVVDGHGGRIHSYRVYPLRKVRYQAPNNRANIKFEALKQFSSITFLLIICVLLNYIMLFVSRVQSRRSEFALNKVNGASNKEILLLLMVEYSLMIVAAIFLGSVLTELLFPQFSRFSMTAAPKGYFLVSIFWYSILIILLSVLAMIMLTYRFVRQSVLQNIAPRAKIYARQKNSFPKIAIFIQLSIVVLLIFCTIMVYNQYHLMNQRVGYNRNGLVTYYTNKENIPVSEMREIVGTGNYIINSEGVIARYRSKMLIDLVDNEQQIKSYNFHRRFIDANAFQFLEIPILRGRDLLPSEDAAYFINEAGNRELGNNAIGNTIYGIPIIGVIPDLQVGNSFMEEDPVLYSVERLNGVQMGESIIFRFDNDSTEKRVREWFNENLPHTSREGYFTPGYLYEDIDTRFKEFTKSERNLMMLISIITAVAILIAVFGIYSMITLSCNQRRKEIAIRKVNGAKAGEIFLLFFREYFVITLLSCVVAFPVGVFVMQHWLEQYTRRVSIEWWMFAGIFILVTLIVLASIFYRVSRAAKENPASVMKLE